MPRPTMALRATIALALIPAAVASAALTSDAASRSARIHLSADTQPKPERPTLDKLVALAEQRGVTLAQAIDEHVTEVTGHGTDAATLPYFKIDDLPLAELVDLEDVAEAEGITHKQAIDRYGWQPAFRKVTDTLRQAYPDEITATSMSQDGRGARLAFKGPIPPRAITLARTLPVAVDLVGETGFSEREVEAARTKALKAVTGRAGTGDVGASFDAEKGTVSIEVEAEATTQEVRQDLGEVARSTLPADSEIRIDVKVVDELDIEPQDKYIRGGGLLDEGCTVGFVVNYHASAKQAISTAGHCTVRPTYTYYNHSRDGGSTVVRSVIKHQGGRGDIALYTRGSMTATRTFYYAKNRKRYVDDSSAFAPGVGSQICHFGRVTGKHCGQVSDRDYSYYNERQRVTYEHLVMADGERNFSDRGDSGGPWYYGNTAYGIHHGGSRTPPHTWGTFTPVHQLRMFGVFVYQR
ncbi:S1 family peptidase [Nonomuraea sp. MCN248]|uniref:S1 family peptidase n=1 Tax=Nonomuraea corallina TaxID=2989783 RepID=A0ABT4SD74_9ACTN|nr:S1 family peptidase [Nonomuraea corallina]MDA0635158.1 S1 family peptidase [Nonomuraea corallina]